MFRSCVLCVAVSVVSALSGAPTVGAATRPAPPSGEARLEQAILVELNAQRRAVGLRQLVASQALALTAKQHASYQAFAGTLTHVGPGGSTVTDRLRGTVRAAAVGEVIALRPGRRPRAKVFVAQWLRSPAHRAVLLDGRFVRIGLGAARARRGMLVTANLASG